MHVQGPMKCRFPHGLRVACLIILMPVVSNAVDNALQVTENCDSKYWHHVAATLAKVGPTLSNMKRQDIIGLMKEEQELKSPADSAGCEIGRLSVSALQLTVLESAERSMHLKHRFGVGFYRFAWQLYAPWPLFQALARLRWYVHKDPAGHYPQNECDVRGNGNAAADKAASELLHGLSVIKTGIDEPVTQAANAALFLAHVDQELACPLAVAAAYLTIAISLLPSHGATHSEVQHLVQLGMESSRRWKPRKIPFLDMLTTSWPVWDLMAKIEHTTMMSEVAHVTHNPPQAHSDDPREPRCLRTDRAALADSLNSTRIEAIVVFGRRDRVEILHPYLWKNLRVNGGVLDRVIFVVLWAMQDDLDFLDQLIKTNAPHYVMPPVTGRRLAKIYSVCKDPETVYLKIDDDIVYIHDSTIPELVKERLRGRCSFVSANVVNHAILSAIHQDIGAIRNFFPTEEDDLGTGSDSDDETLGNSSLTRRHQVAPWVRDDSSLPITHISKQAQSNCVWRLWQCAAWMHESFLSRVSDGTECAYDFGWHDFHSHGYGAFRGDRLVPLPYSRWSINFIAFMAQDLVPAVQDELAEDDESELSYTVPQRLGRRSCAIGRALVAHFSYSKQEDGLLQNTDLLERYRQLSVSAA